MSGRYIAVANLNEMIITEQEVNVFQVVHDIRRTRPQFIDSQVNFFPKDQQAYRIVFLTSQQCSFWLQFEVCSHIVSRILVYINNK